MTILCIIGPSGSGKTTLANAMAEGASAPTEAATSASIPTICSYTTRPMRHGEQNGREHIFVDDHLAARLLTTHHPLAYTRFGGHHYFALWSQLFLTPSNPHNLTPSQPHNLTTYVIDESGYLALNNAIINYEEDMQSKSLPCRTIYTLPIFIERDARIISQTIDPARVSRDQDRPYLNLVHPAIIIHNDAPTAQAFAEWSQHLRDSLLLTMSGTPRNYVNPVHLSTRMGVAEIIAHLNGAL